MVVAILQARMAATRLPGKVLKKVNSKELLLFQYQRILKSKLIDKIIIATTLSESDDAIYDFCYQKTTLKCLGVMNKMFLPVLYMCKKILMPKLLYA